MKIGFYLKWAKHSLGQKQGNVLGDELYGESLALSLRKFPKVTAAEVYAPNHLPNDRLDVMIYLNDSEPNRTWAKSHVLYLQNAYSEAADSLLKRLTGNRYDGFLFFSKHLLEIHESAGGHGLFLPFGVDTDFFYPRDPDRNLEYEVSYIGNDIKGTERSMCYLYPAHAFHFGLYGNWQQPKSKYKIWNNWHLGAPYKGEFARISRGKIPQEQVPVLYSSTKINLNCTSQSCVDWDVITLRTFEILACRGFLITDSVPIARELLKDCAIFTRGKRELTEQIQFYLANPGERRRIALNGYNYVRKHATVDARSTQLLDYLKKNLL